MITKKQRAVIEDLFADGLNEQQVLDKHKVSRNIYQKWQMDEFFLREFELRLKQERRQSELIVARYATFAVGKLIQLTESENQETARKACLDIIGLLRPGAAGTQNDDATDPPAELPPELASRLLAALAESSPSSQKDTRGETMHE